MFVDLCELETSGVDGVLGTVTQMGPRGTAFMGNMAGG